MEPQPQYGNYYGVSSPIRQISGLRLAERTYAPDLKTPPHSHPDAYFCLILEGSSRQTYGSKNRVREPLTTAFYPPNELQSEKFGQGAKRIPTSVLESYTGKYDGGKIVVSLEQGQLYFLGASGVRRRLYALADDTFLIEDQSVPPENEARVRFIKNAAGNVTELQLMVADGRTFPRAKENQ